MLDDPDLDYLDRRRKALQYLGFATWALPVIWLACILIGAWQFPALLDPVSLAQQMDAGIVDWKLVRTLARIAPTLFLTLLLVISGAVFIFLRSMYRERRLLEVVDRLQRGSVTPP